jgi:hypothetical protein
MNTVLHVTIDDVVDVSGGTYGVREFCKLNFTEPKKT